MDGAPPLDFGDDDLFAVPPKRPAVRRNDHDTSRAAADKAAVAQGTIKAAVLSFAETAGPAGFMDDQLVEANPDSPESSWRKRRTELTQEGHLCDSGSKRMNRQGNLEVVWVHRMFANSPPPDAAPDMRRAPARAKPADADLKARGKATATEMLKWSDSMHKEGRMMFASALQEAAELMRLLSI